MKSLDVEEMSKLLSDFKKWGDGDFSTPTSYIVKILGKFIQVEDGEDYLKDLEVVDLLYNNPKTYEWLERDHNREMANQDDKLEDRIRKLPDRLGREPTDDDIAIETARVKTNKEYLVAVFDAKVKNITIPSSVIIRRLVKADILTVFRSRTGYKFSDENRITSDQINRLIHLFNAQRPQGTKLLNKDEYTVEEE